MIDKKVEIKDKRQQHEKKFEQVLDNIMVGIFVSKLIPHELLTAGPTFQECVGTTAQIWPQAHGASFRLASFGGFPSPTPPVASVIPPTLQLVGFQALLQSIR
jgi:hypothetical protein